MSAERDAAREALARVEALAAEWEREWDNAVDHGWSDMAYAARRGAARRIRAVLPQPATPAEHTCPATEALAVAWEKGEWAGRMNAAEVQRIAHWSHIGPSKPSLIKNPFITQPATDEPSPPLPGED